MSNIDRKSPFDGEEAAAVLSWFDREGIIYPWGDDPTPYRVWVSEVMLQQTGVAQVVPYFLRFIRHFPDIAALAAASEGEVLRYWEGLGYYSRARNLLAAAKQIIRYFDGRFPSDPEAIRSLPGIGEYITAAISSLAFQRPVPAIDANVRRILLRLDGRSEWTGPFGRLAFESLASAMPADHPGKLNAALMQYGQIVCLPREPRCAVCPLRRRCRAAEEGHAGSIPRRKSKEITAFTTRLMVILRGEAVLLRKREEGIGRGLWSFPPLTEAASSARKLGVLRTRVHAYTRFRETLVPEVYRDLEVGGGDPPDPGGVWVALGKLPDMAMPAVYRRITDELLDFLQSRRNEESPQG